MKTIPITVLLVALCLLGDACRPKQEWQPVGEDLLPAKPSKDSVLYGEDRSAEFARKAAFYRAEYVAHYDMVVGSTDTFYTPERLPVVVEVTLYCLFDSALVIPGRYVLEDPDATFVTHHYAQDVIVKKGTANPRKFTLFAGDFYPYLPSELQAYGTLTDFETPVYDPASGQLLFSTTIAIPITEIGRRIFYTLDPDDGRLQFRAE